MKISKVRKLKDKAVHFLSKNKYKKALGIYQSLQQVEPNDVSLMLKIGDVNRLLGNSDAAISAYSHAAKFYARDGMLLRGIAVCKVILDIDADHTATQEKLADLYAKKFGGPRVPHAEPDNTAPVEEIAPEKGAAIPEADEEEVAVDIDLSEAYQADEKEKEVEIAVTEEVKEVTEEVTEEDTEDDDDEDIDIDEEGEGEEVEYVPTLPPEPEELPHIPLFSDLDRDSFIDLLGRVPVHKFEAGEQLVSEDDEGRSLYVVVSGLVQVMKIENTPLAKLGPGAFFGEMALVTKRPRRASVTALETSEVLEISTDELARLGKRFPHITDVLKRFTVQRLLHNLVLTSPLFTPFSKEVRKDLMRRFKRKSFASETNIIEQGQEGEGLYLIVSGCVDVVRHNDKGEEQFISSLAEGDLFGEIALLTRSQATATVRAAHKCEVLCLPKNTFNEVILTHPQILMLVADLSEKRQQNLEAILDRDLATSREGGSAPL